MHLHFDFGNISMVLLMEVVVMKIIFLNIVGILLAISINAVAESIIAFKEKQRNKKYERYHHYRPTDSLINGFILLGLFNGLAFEVGGLTLLMYFVMAYLTILLYRVDQYVRIIPNEAVLLIFLIHMMSQIVNNGLKGILNGFLAMIYVGMIFYIAGVFLESLTGEFGVGAGDIKLSMALGMAFDLSSINCFLVAIAIALLFYVIVGFILKRITLKSTFPMAIQIMSAYLIASCIIPILL